MRPHTKPPRFIFSGIGTKGDTLPLLALGREMLRRGHPVHLLSNAGLAALAKLHGVEVTAVTVEQTDNLRSSEENLERHILPSYAPTFQYFNEQMRRQEPVIVVNLDEFSATNLMCEKHMLPLCRIHLAPWRIHSLIRPPFPYNKPLEGRLSTTFRKHRLPHIYASLDRPTSFLTRLNPYRQRLGLPPVTRLTAIDAVVTRRLGLFPSWYAERAPDWPGRFELAGFPLPPSLTAPPSKLTAFLERQGKPLVFTPGTGVPDVECFFHEARQCCEALGMPGIFLSPYFKAPRAGLGSRIVHFDFLDLELVLKNAALLVHHGGIGTTARALQAGVPQIIRPVAYDQFDNGDRITSLGVGKSLVPEEYSNDRLIDATRMLTSNGEVKRNLERFKCSLAGSDALAAAAATLEGMAAEAQGHGEATRLASRASTN